MLVGLVLYGIAIAAIVRGAVGAAPWDVLSQGLMRVTGLSFGTLTVLISGLVLLCWIPLRQAPRFGTIANSLLVGPAADVGFLLTPADLPLWARILVFTGGLLLLAVATGLYLSPQFGPGPRDGLMTGLHRRLGLPIWLARTLVEGTVLAIGWMLGGNVGVGTAIFALAVGPLCGWTIPRFAMAEPRARTTTPLER
ncbi:hypothetical protein GB864_08560 [Agromyces sp. MMS17-SY077]|uniref:Membrane protein YczE n=1 Tax=Agromyces seonyuensis TaxID=2662446 RepID=A0A6I4NVY2_9MICO|nr:hypothetical protein [Agromyces seonyuensis]